MPMSCLYDFSGSWLARGVATRRRPWLLLPATLDGIFPFMGPLSDVFVFRAGVEGCDDE